MRLTAAATATASLSLLTSTWALPNGPLVNQLQKKLYQHFQPTDDGLIVNFPPYLTATFTNFGATAEIRCSTNGQNIDEINYEVSKSGYKNWGFAHGINMFNAGMEIGSVIDTISYNDHGEWATGPMGVEVDMSRDITIDFKQASQPDGKIKERISLDLGFSGSGKSAALSLEFDASKESSNVEPTKQFSPKSIVDKINSDLFGEDGQLELDGSIYISDVEQCSKTNFAQKKCTIEFESTFKMNQAGMVKPVVLRPKASLKFKRYAIVFNYGLTDGPSSQLFIRGEDKSGRSASLISNQWFGLYRAPGSNWQKAIKSGSSELLLRLPSMEHFLSVTEWERRQLREPWMQLHYYCLLAPEKIPYIFWYFDEFVATFDSEFDLSGVIRKSRVQSDLIGKLIGAPNNDLNEYLANLSSDINAKIIEALQCPELDQAMGMMREYVRTMGSQEGHQEFERLFGQIF